MIAMDSISAKPASSSEMKDSRSSILDLIQSTTDVAHNQPVPFPWKLHEMLECADGDNFSGIVSWLPDETSFKVHKTDAFVADIMPRYFKQTKYKSFQRQLNMWGFTRLLAGAAKGGYTHTEFVRGQPALCRNMKRQKIKGTGAKRGTPSVGKEGGGGGGGCYSGMLQQNQTGVASSLKSMPLPTIVKKRSPPASAQSQHSRNSTRMMTKKESDPNQSINSLTMQLENDKYNGGQQNMGLNDSLFDEDTLLEVLHVALDNNKDQSPEIGDSVLFAGRQFFLVEEEDDQPPPDTSSSRKQSRRLSLELSMPVTTSSTTQPHRRQARRFSLELSMPAATSNSTTQPHRRQARRFSLVTAPVEHEPIRKSPDEATSAWNPPQHNQPSRRQARRFSLEPMNHQMAAAAAATHNSGRLQPACFAIEPSTSTTSYVLKEMTQL